jgi:hypothetical protein
VEENSVEASDTGIDQRIKNHLVNLQSRFSKYFTEAVSDKYKRITDSFHVDSPQNNDFSLLKKKLYSHYIYYFLKSSVSCEVEHRIFGGHWRGVPSPHQKSFEHPPSFHNNLPVREWIFSSGTHQNKVFSVINLENDPRAAISKLNTRYDKLC